MARKRELTPAQMGTLAHKVAEMYVNQHLYFASLPHDHEDKKNHSTFHFHSWLKARFELDGFPEVNEPMVRCAEFWWRAVEFAAYSSGVIPNSGSVFVEKKVSLNLGELRKEEVSYSQSALGLRVKGGVLEGRIDAFVYSPFTKILTILDYKYGHAKVSPHRNLKMRFYALAAMQTFPKVNQAKRVLATIVQPNQLNSNHECATTTAVSDVVLESFRESLLRSALRKS